MSKLKLAIKCFEQKIIALVTEEYQLRRSKYFSESKTPTDVWSGSVKKKLNKGLL